MAKIIPVTDPTVDAPDGSKITFPDGFVYERISGDWVCITTRCEGVTSTWCSVHGDCACEEGDDGLPTLDDPTCPLHNPNGPHGVWFNEERQ